IMPHCIDNTEPEALTYFFTHDPCWGNLTTLRCVSDEQCIAVMPLYKVSLFAHFLLSRSTTLKTH
ncbi:hypothetical protein J4W31_23555, partial [Escherichia coli]